MNSFNMKLMKIENYISQLNENSVSQISQFNYLSDKQPIFQALKVNKLDVGYYLLLKSDCIFEDYFECFKSITKIALPISIKSILNYAFNNCSSLTQIAIPSSVTSIRSNAFY